MKHFKNFFKNSRFVWKDDVPKVFHALKAGEEEEGPSWDEVEKTREFLEQADASCAAAEEGSNVIQQRICSLAEMEKTPEAVKLRQFIDELAKAILEDEEFRSSNSFKRFQLLQEVTDFDAIMEHFNEAESYEIRPYVLGENPAMIIFAYPDGTTEEYHLELSTKQKKALWRTLGTGARESLEKDRKVTKVARKGKETIADWAWALGMQISPEIMEKMYDAIEDFRARLDDNLR